MAVQGICSLELSDESQCPTHMHTRCGKVYMCTYPYTHTYTNTHTRKLWKYWGLQTRSEVWIRDTEQANARSKGMRNSRAEIWKPEHVCFYFSHWSSEQRHTVSREAFTNIETWSLFSILAKACTSHAKKQIQNLSFWKKQNGMCLAAECTRTPDVATTWW